MYSLLAVCVCAIVLAPTRYNIISTLLAAEFMLMIGIDILVFDQISTFDQSAYIYTIKLMIQCVFTLAWMYFSAWPIAIVSAVIMGIFSYSIAAALSGTVAQHYTQIMQVMAVIEIAALLAGAAYDFSDNINRGRGLFNRKSNLWVAIDRRRTTNNRARAHVLSNCGHRRANKCAVCGSWVCYKTIDGKDKLANTQLQRSADDRD